MAHGDPTPSDPKTVDLLEDILLEFLFDLCAGAHRVSGFRQRLKVDDLRFLCRRNPILLGRIEEILKKEEQVRKAKSLLNPDMNEIARFGDSDEDDVFE